MASYLLIGFPSYLIHFLLPSSLSGSISAHPWITQSILNQEWLLTLLSQFQEYILFMLIVCITTFTLKLLQRHGKSTKHDFIESLSAKKGSRFWQPKFKALIYYSFLFCFLTSIQDFFVKNLSNSKIIMILHQDLNDDLSNLSQENLLLPSRRLEAEVPAPTSILSPSSSLSSSISSPIVRVLSSLGMTAYYVILSKDSKTAFVSLGRSGGLKIIDVSNPENPIIITSIKLKPVERRMHGRDLALSQDGKTLFASNMHHLEIIDVSILEMPVIMGQFEDENITKLLQDGRLTDYTLDYRVSMALSRDHKTIFIGGMGLQIIDISDLKNPALISSNSEELSDDNLLLTQIQISQNGEKLYLVNGSLNIYNVMDAKNLQLLGSYSLPDYSISSIFLSKKHPEEVAFLLGARSDQEMIFGKINISDPTKPTNLKSYHLKYGTSKSPYILGLCLDENVALILIWDEMNHQDIGVLNLVKKNFKREENTSLIKNATSLAVFPEDDSKIIIAQNFMKLTTIQFDINFPNKRIFSFSKNPLGSLVTQSHLLLESPILTSDGKTLIVRRGSMYSLEGALEVIDISNYSSPALLSSYPLTGRIREIRYLEDAKKVVILYLGQNGRMTLLDLFNLSNPTLIADFSITNLDLVLTTQFSSDGKRAYIISLENGTNYFLSILDFSDFANIKILSQNHIDTTSKSVLTKDNKILIILGTKIAAYNLSNPEKPFETSSILGESDSISFAALSSDEKFLYAKVYAGSAYSLRIYDISDLYAIKFQGDLLLPKAKVSQERGLTFSSDNQKAYIGSDEGHILGINISNPSSPFVQETWNVATAVEKCDIQSVKLSQNGKKMIYLSGYELGIIDLTVPYSLYLHTENILLGQKYSESVPMLKLNDKQEYKIFDRDHRFLKASLFSVKADPAKEAPEMSYLPFPYWMSFDKENQILTAEPVKQENLGTYTLYSAFSTKLPENVLRQILQSKDDGSLTNEDLIMMLISYGYLDNQMYLTPRFEKYEDFRIPKEYTSLKKDIFSVLKKYYFETFTMLDIFPSLDATYDDRISINTLSSNPIRVEIMLVNKRNGFVNKQCGSIKPAITEGKSRIILEGSQKEINNALRLLVINLENNNTLCGGVIVISDRLNPTVTRFFANISKFFNVNEAPKIEIPLQGQIDSTSISTGTYFTVNFKNGTFADTRNNDLSFELTSGEPGKSVPLWISFANMSLRGTPPEEIIWHELKFNLIVKNEFKENKISFTLNIKISPTFALKLLIRYSPYILTILGLIIYANKIYNISCKKRYRYPRDFYLKVGEEITSSVIPPMIFIWKEKQESMIILKYLKTNVAQELGVKTIKDIEFSQWFASSEGTRIDKEKLIKKIQDIFISAPEKILKKLDLYLDGPKESQTLINQIIFNQLTLGLLEINQETKKFFESIKSEWIDLVDWDTCGLCKIRENQLLELLFEADLENNKPKENNEDYSRMTDNNSLKEIFNIDLLKDAIEGHAFNQQSIDYHSPLAHVMIKYKMETNFIMKFVKMDLENVNLSDHAKMTYGIHFKVENDVLSFHGIPERKLLKKTVVVQITNKKHRILKEIWIHGVSKDQSRNSKNFQGNETVVQETSYEVY